MRTSASCAPRWTFWCWKTACSTRKPSRSSRTTRTGGASTAMTDDKARQRERAALERFFERELMPLAQDLKAKGTLLLDGALAPQASSYYLDRTPQPGAQAPAQVLAQVLEWGGADSVEDLERQLVRLWRDPASPPLAPLAPSIAKLAELLRRDEEQSAQGSEFVYVMY